MLFVGGWDLVVSGKRRRFRIPQQVNHGLLGDLLVRCLGCISRWFIISKGGTWRNSTLVWGCHGPKDGMSIQCVKLMLKSQPPGVRQQGIQKEQGWNMAWLVTCSTVPRYLSTSSHSFFSIARLSHLAKIAIISSIDLESVEEIPVVLQGMTLCFRCKR